MKNNSNRNIRNVIRNEWRNAFASANTVLFMTLFPVLILVQMFVIIWLVSSFVSPDVLSGTIPAVIVTWFCAGLSILGVAIIGPSSLVKYLMTPAWLISLILVVPAITLMSFLLGVIGSARAKDARSAQQLAVIIVFPIFGLVVIQLLGVIAYSPLILVLLGVLILLLDLLTLRIAVRLFRRESIVSKWK